MRKTLTILLLTLILILPVYSAHAQDSIRFSRAEVNLWPEYDQPAILVIYRITLSAETPLPVNLTVRIPAAAGEPNAVAARQTDGQLFTIQYTREASGDWQTLSLTATMPELQIEYYDPSLVIDGTQRSYGYTWPADHAVDAMLIEIQQPLNATNTTITPGPVSSTIGGDGLTYYYKDIGMLPVNQSFSLSVGYQKATDDLTVAGQPVGPTSPLPTTPEWQTSLINALPWIVGVLGVGLISGAAIWYWRTGQQRQLQVSKRRTHRGRASADSHTPGDIYCHQCGHRAGAGDRFCRACGTKLRLE